MELFSINSKFFQLMARLADLMILSAWWLMCSLPLFTLGAASAALYACVDKLLREEGPSPTRAFFRAFRENFKGGVLVMGLIFLAGVLASAAGSALYALTGPERLTDIYFACLVLGSLILGWLHYVLAHLARFEAPLAQILKNSLLITLVNLPWTLSLVVLFLAVWGIFALFLPGSALFIFLLPGVYCMVTRPVLERVFRKYLPAPEE